MRYLFLVLTAATLMLPAAASGSEIRFRTGTSQEMSGSGTINSSILLTVVCTHTMRLTSRNLRRGTAINTSLLISRAENTFSSCTYTSPILFCSGTATVVVNTDWTLTAQAAVSGSAPVTIDTGNPAMTITLTGGSCLSACIITVGTSRISGSWTNPSPALLTFSRQRISYTTNDRTCGGVRSGTAEFSYGLFETYNTVAGTVSVS